MPAPTAALVAASTRLTRLDDVAQSLVCNAVAARAQRISLSVNLADWRVECADDGAGVPLAVLHRLKDDVDHNARPTSALLAAAALARVEVWTCCPGQEQAHLLTLRPGRAALAPAPRGVDPHVRTRIVVRDLFHNLPVRRRALSSASNKPGLRAQWEQIKHRLALVCVPLASSPIHLELNQALPNGRRKLFRSPACAGLVARYRSLLMLSTPGIEPVWLEAAVHVQSTTPGLQVEGLVANPPPSAKAPSLVYINGELLEPHMFASHWLAERLTLSSSHPHPHPHTHPIQPRPLPRHLTQGVLAQPLTAFLRSLAANALEMETEPVVVVNVVISLSALPEGQRQARILQRAIGGEWYGLLAGQSECLSLGSSPRKRKRDTNSSTTAPHIQHAIDTKRRVSRRACVEEPRAFTRPPSLPLPAVPKGTIAWRDPTTRSSCVVDARTGNHVAVNRAPASASASASASIAASATGSALGQGHTLRRKLGLARKTPTSPVHALSCPKWLEETVTSFRRSPCSGALSDSDSSRLWAEERGTAKPLPVVGLPGAESGLSGLAGPADAQSVGQGADLVQLSLTRASLASARIVGQFERKCLLAVLPAGGGGSILVGIDQHAADERVRVETFFLQYLRDCRRSARLDGEHVVPLPPRVEPTDNDGIRARTSPWAAAEAAEADTGAHQRLTPPLALHAHLAPGHLGRVADLCSCAPNDPGLASVFRGMLAFWGFHVALGAAPAGPAEGLALTAAPSLIAERLQRDARSLCSRHLAGQVVQAILMLAEGAVGAGGTRIDAGWTWMAARVRRAAAAATKTEEGAGAGAGPGPGPETDSEAGELGMFVRLIPRPVRHMIESTACRGAVMFNDALDTAEAARLVACLAQTQFPFQCAHGRPSLVPLVRLLASAGAGEAEHGVRWEALAQNTGSK